MKTLTQTAFFACFCFFGMLTVLQAQDKSLQNLSEPEFAFDPMIVNTDFSTIPLPKENVAITMRGTTKKIINELMIDKAHSAFSIKGDSVIILVKNGMLNGTIPNPRDVIKLYKLTVDDKKKKRVGEVATLDRSGTGKIVGTNASLDVPLTFTKVKESLYLIKLYKLESGEYALLSGNYYFTFKME